MHDDTPDGFDWDRFWADASGPRRRSAHVGQFGNPDLLERFFETTTWPADFAAFGCGPAGGPLELAARHPELTVYGYDSSAAAIDQARTDADARDLDNTTFEVDHLPDLTVDRMFDVVYCYATLHYIADIDAALHSLLERTRPGGYLVFNYPNRFTLAENRRLLRGDADRPLPMEPAEFRERFALVFEEENLLSYGRIAEVLGSRPRSFWSAVDAPDEPWIGRHNPCVYIER